jgi:hypothetical protein
MHIPKWRLLFIREFRPFCCYFQCFLIVAFLYRLLLDSLSLIREPLVLKLPRTPVIAASIPAPARMWVIVACICVRSPNSERAIFRQRGQRLQLLTTITRVLVTTWSAFSIMMRSACTMSVPAYSYKKCSVTHPPFFSYPAYHWSIRSIQLGQ